MKQTAVYKLLEYFIKEQKEGCSHWCIHDLIAQLYVAKEMEKEQMEKTWVAGLYCETGDRQAFIDYYNENYKSQEDDKV